jgi:hypothetical protein
MLANLVQESANNPGTGTTVNLLGSPSGRTAFVSAFGSGAMVYYRITDGVQWEIGQGTVTAGSPNTLARATVLSNSAGNTSHINFTGAVQVYNVLPAERAVLLNSSGNLQFGAAVSVGLGAAPSGGFSLDIYRTSTNVASIRAGNDATSWQAYAAGASVVMGAVSNHPVLFTVNNAEVGRWLTNGELIVTPNGSFTGDAVAVTPGVIRTRRNTTAAAGHYEFRNPTGVVGSITTDGSATLFNTSSDARLKDVAGTIDASGAALDALVPVRYRWRSAPESPVLTGFLAQDVAAVVPEAVAHGRGEPGDDDFVPHGLDLSRLVPLLWAEVRGLRARVAALEAART